MAYVNAKHRSNDGKRLMIQHIIITSKGSQGEIGIHWGTDNPRAWLVNYRYEQLPIIAIGALQFQIYDYEPYLSMAQRFSVIKRVMLIEGLDKS